MFFEERHRKKRNSNRKRVNRYAQTFSELAEELDQLYSSTGVSSGMIVQHFHLCAYPNPNK